MTLKKYFHIGIAVDTPHGLMVPKIRNVNNKNISYISNELKEIRPLPDFYLAKEFRFRIRKELRKPS